MLRRCRGNFCLVSTGWFSEGNEKWNDPENSHPTGGFLSGTYGFIPILIPYLSHQQVNKGSQCFHLGKLPRKPREKKEEENKQTETTHVQSSPTRKWPPKESYIYIYMYTYTYIYIYCIYIYICTCIYIYVLACTQQLGASNSTWGFPGESSR